MSSDLITPMKMPMDGLVGKRQINAYSTPRNELEVLDTSDTTILTEKKQPVGGMSIINAVQMEARRARKRSKSFNVGRTKNMFAARMMSVMMAQRFKRAAMLKKKNRQLVNVKDVKDSSQGVLEVESKYEKAEAKSPFDPKMKIDQRREASVRKPQREPVNMERNQKKNYNDEALTVLRGKINKLKRHKFVFKEKFEHSEKKLKTEREKRKKLIEEMKVVKKKLREVLGKKSSGEKVNCDDLSVELMKENESLKKNVVELRKEIENLKSQPKTQTTENLPEGMDEMKELMEKRKLFFEKKMKQLAKKVIDYEDIIKKIKFRAGEIKKQNITFGKENKLLFQQVTTFKKEKNEIAQKYEKLVKTMKYLKSIHGGIFAKLNIETNF